MGLTRWRPDTVIYYETLSALPALLYKRTVGRETRLFIHYHEYTSPGEYEKGPLPGRWLHRIEKRSYRQSDGISHTNADRISLFRNDLTGQGVEDIVFALPNYPPASWRGAGGEKAVLGQPLRIVYAGALGLDTMYTREFAGMGHQAGRESNMGHLFRQYQRRGQGLSGGAGWIRS